MADQMELLRMLEPAVRPTGGKVGGSARSVTPFEQRDFQSLLSEARQTMDRGEPTVNAADATSSTDPGEQMDEAGDAEAAKTGEASPPSPLNALRSLDSIENTSLRQLIAETGAAAAKPAADHAA